VEIGAEGNSSSDCSLWKSIMPRECMAHAAYLSMHHGMFAVHNDLPGRRDHERRHHGGRLLPVQRRRAIFLRGRDVWQLRGQLGRHCVYGRGFRCLCSVRRRRVRREEERCAVVSWLEASSLRSRTHQAAPLSFSECCRLLPFQYLLRVSRVESRVEDVIRRRWTEQDGDCWARGHCTCTTPDKRNDRPLPCRNPS
jgi:hypothetical protein